MFSYFKNRKQQRLDDAFHRALWGKEWAKVADPLQQGADPNARPPYERHSALADAIQYGAPLATIIAFLDAGADPQEPYRYLAVDFRLSELAKMSKCDTAIVRRLEEAEAQAEARHGARTLDRGRSNKRCGLPYRPPAP